MSGVPSAEREWEKVDAKDVLACIQWQPRTYTVKVEENNKPISQAFDKDAWCFKLEVHGPGRNVHILGKMTGQKRLPETEFSERPWEVVRQTCTMARNDDGEVNESQEATSTSADKTS